MNTIKKAFFVSLIALACTTAPIRSNPLSAYSVAQVAQKLYNVCPPARIPLKVLINIGFGGLFLSNTLPDIADLIKENASALYQEIKKNINAIPSPKTAAEEYMNTIKDYASKAWACAKVLGIASLWYAVNKIL